MSPEELFNENIKLAYHVAHKWGKSYPYLWDELVQMCLWGLWKAAQAFDPGRGIRFSALASACMDNEARQLLRQQKRQRKDQVSWDGVVSVDGDGSELSLQEIVSVSEAITDAEEEFRRSFPLAAKHRLDGYDQGELAADTGFSQSYISRLIAKETERAKEIIDINVTPAPLRARPSHPTGWDLRLEGEGGPVTVRFMGEEELAACQRRWREEEKGRMRDIPVGEVLALHREGKKPKEIAARFGTSPQKIGMILKANGPKDSAPKAHPSPAAPSLIDQSLSASEKLAMGLAYLMAGGAQVSINLEVKVSMGGGEGA